MIYQKDWLLRQIEMFVQFIARVVFHKDTMNYEIRDETNLGQTDLLYNEIRQLVDAGKICEAEDLLYERMDVGDLSYLELATDFYQTVNKLDDAELERCNFPRDEIHDGLKTVLNLFGFQSFIE
jgi:hypothetical protein